MEFFCNLKIVSNRSNLFAQKKTKRKKNIDPRANPLFVLQDVVFRTHLRSGIKGATSLLPTRIFNEL